jgi:phosphate transport system substrate-binding protein
MRRHFARSTAIVAVLASVLLVLMAQSSQAVTHATIEGSGSSWSALAVNQWVADVTSSGLKVVYTAPGSAQGRKDFANNTTDFAVSDIGFRGVTGGEQDTNQGRAYAYLPIVAGGTSFPYNISFGGKQITNLRLSGLTLVKIFTNKIRNWNDAAITADNNGRKLPSIPIVPLVHSEGSGSTAQLTTYFDTVFPSIWRPFGANTCSGAAGSCFTEYYPKQGAQIGQNGSDQVINFVSGASGNGVITYDEYSYATAKLFPVAKLENANGYFTLPTQYNVAVALTRAAINTNPSSPDYLLQNLANVYNTPDSRAYPLSSYSYMIIPTGASDPRMSTAKRQTLVDYLYYAVCTGQKEMGPIGYSPLPINLVQASFDQANKLKAADPAVDISQRDVSTCQNPTFVAGNPPARSPGWWTDAGPPAAKPELVADPTWSAASATRAGAARAEFERAALASAYLV